MLKSNNFSVFILFILMSCSQGEDTQNQPKKYFDLIQFIDNQLENLQKINPKITKTIITNRDTTQKQVQIKRWESELKPFKECDINIPILLDAYAIEETGEKTIYTAKKSDAKVQKMTIEKSGDEVRAIRIHYKNTSQLYHTERFPEMELENGKLKKYTVRGFQKIQLKDSNAFEIIGVIP